MKMKKQTIKLPIYIGNLTFIRTKKTNKLRKKFGDRIPKNFKDYDAFVFWESNNEYYVVFRKNLKGHIISHEMVHLVNRIFYDHGIDLDILNDEPQAYLHSWLFKQTQKFLR